MNRTKVINTTGNIYILLGSVLCLVAISLLAYPQLPFLFSKLNLNSPGLEAKTLTVPVSTTPVVQEDIPAKEEAIKLPEQDLTLTGTNSLIIPKIGVNAPIIEGVDPKIALDKGPWRVPDYADPEQRFLKQTTQSIIIAAHRFGYSSWTTEYRNKYSFFNLPETKVGDKIVIIWNQREYVYEIIQIEESQNINETNADLILYTCKYYNSVIRIFRYANLVSLNGFPL